MILRHWGLSHDPFAGRPGYVATPVHEEAVARLVYAVESGERRVTLTAGPGLGKTVVLEESLARLRDPRRRLCRVAAPLDGVSLLHELTRRLGGVSDPRLDRPGAWRAFLEVVRLYRVQGIALVLALDDAHTLATGPDRADLARLASIDCHPAARVSWLCVGRPADPTAYLDPDGWDLAIRLVRLTRSEAGQYLHARLATAGRVEPTFTPRAITRLHGLTGGVPRGLDRLASLALAAGALRRLEVIGPEIVDAVSAECEPDPAWA